MRETWVQSLCWEDPLEESMATHFSILAWRIPMNKRNLAGYSPWGCKESDMTEKKSTYIHIHLGLLVFHPLTLLLRSFELHALQFMEHSIPNPNIQCGHLGLFRGAEGHRSKVLVILMLQVLPR